jgi:uncharacterized membrane protein
MGLPFYLLSSFLASSQAKPVLIGAFAPPDPVIGVPYSYNVTALFSGSVNSYSQTGGTPLSGGLSLVGGFIEGTPTELVTFTDVVVSANGSNGSTPTNADTFSVISAFTGTITSVTNIVPGENFTITGTNMTTAHYVSYAGIQCPIVSQDATTIVATAPASGFLFNEYYDLVVL